MEGEVVMFVVSIGVEVATEAEKPADEVTVEDGRVMMDLEEDREVELVLDAVIGTLDDDSVTSSVDGIRVLDVVDALIFPILIPTSRKSSQN